MSKKGFTLVELIIVVIIIGILAAIALPQYSTTHEKARSAEALSNIGALRTAVDRYWYNQVAFVTSYTAATLDTLDIDNPNSISGKFYTYAVEDTSNLATRAYIIDAKRNGKEETYWLKWTQTNNTTGKLTKSSALGGPTS